MGSSLALRNSFRWVNDLPAVPENATRPHPRHSTSPPPWGLGQDDPHSLGINTLLSYALQAGESDP